MSSERTSSRTLRNGRIVSTNTETRKSIAGKRGEALAGKTVLFSDMSRQALRRELRKRDMLSNGTQLPNDRAKVVEMLRLWEWDNWLKANPTFHLFGRFPAEIKLMIFKLWEHRGPRIIHLKIIRGPDGYIWFKNRPFEVGLQVCQLSRSSITAKSREVFGVPGLYANLEVDALLLDGWDVHTNLRAIMPKRPGNREEVERTADMRKKVKHIILPYEFMQVGFSLHPEMASMLIDRGLRLFKGLKTLSLAYGPKEYFVDVLGPRRTCLAPEIVDERTIIDDDWFHDILRIWSYIRESNNPPHS